MFKTYQDEADRLTGIAAYADAARITAQSVFDTTKNVLDEATDKVTKLQGEYDTLEDSLDGATAEQTAQIKAQMASTSADWRVAMGAVDVAQRDHNGADEALTAATNVANAASNA